MNIHITIVTREDENAISPKEIATILYTLERTLGGRGNYSYEVDPEDDGDDVDMVLYNLRLEDEIEKEV